jgi:hypothetical protein
MNRRHLLQGLAGLGAGLLLPATVEENAEAVRRYWALDRTMVHRIPFVMDPDRQYIYAHFIDYYAGSRVLDYTTARMETRAISDIDWETTTIRLQSGLVLT